MSKAYKANQPRKMQIRHAPGAKDEKKGTQGDPAVEDDAVRRTWL